MNSNDSDSNQSTAEDTGSYIVQTMMTAISQLNALRTAGYIVTLDVPDATSTPSLTVKCATQETLQKRHLLSTLKTLQNYGWDLNRLNPTSKESLLPFLGRLVGKSSQVVEDTLQEYSSRTSTQQEQESHSSKSGMVKVVSAGSPSQEVYLQYAMDSIVYDELRDFCWQQRAVETQSSCGGQDVQQLESRLRAVEELLRTCASTAMNTDLY